MIKRLEPAELKAAREESGRIVYFRVSMDDVIKIIDEAFARVSEGPLNLIAEEADTERTYRCAGEIDTDTDRIRGEIPLVDPAADADNNVCQRNVSRITPRRRVRLSTAH